MNLAEVVEILQLPRDDIKAAINKGIKHPITPDVIKLEAYPLNGDYDISDESVDAFIEAFFSHEPNRKIPVVTRRVLLIEAKYRCANCLVTVSLEFHHIIEFSRLATHDPRYMIVLCANCHARCTKGEIDRKAQDIMKARLKNDSIEGEQFPIRFDWNELKEVIATVHEVMNVSESGEESKNNRSVVSLHKKNELNQMGEDYFRFIQDQHQPYFGRIKEFIQNPANRDSKQLYYEIIDGLNAKIIAHRREFGNFEHILERIYDTAKPYLKGKGRTLNVFLSFAYHECDLGIKSDVET
ncbi:MAG: HNH endonuclease [Anaerolineae bacterium]|nr:HNH endonuclease [Anaerolineae bacterium]